MTTMTTTRATTSEIDYRLCRNSVEHESKRPEGDPKKHSDVYNRIRLCKDYYKGYLENLFMSGHNMVWNGMFDYSQKELLEEILPQLPKAISTQDADAQRDGYVYSEDSDEDESESESSSQINSNIESYIMEALRRIPLRTHSHRNSKQSLIDKYIPILPLEKAMQSAERDMAYESMTIADDTNKVGGYLRVSVYNNVKARIGVKDPFNNLCITSGTPIPYCVAVESAIENPHAGEFDNCDDTIYHVIFMDESFNRIVRIRAEEPQDCNSFEGVELDGDSNDNDNSEPMDE